MVANASKDVEKDLERSLLLGLKLAKHLFHVLVQLIAAKHELSIWEDGLKRAMQSMIVVGDFSSNRRNWLIFLKTL